MPSSLSDSDDEFIGMKEAIDLLGITQPTFYRWLREGRLSGMKAGRQWRFRRSEIERFLRGEEPSQPAPKGAEVLLDDLRGRLPASEVAGVGAGEGGTQSDTGDVLRQAVELSIRLAVHSQASGLSIEADGRLRLRIDGAMQTISVLPEPLRRAYTDAWKTRCCCNVQLRHVPQDGRSQIEQGGRRIDLHACFLPTIRSETLTVRLVPMEKEAVKLDVLPMRDEQRQIIERALSQPNGMIICNGPVGAGKTTTLFAMLQHLIAKDHKIITIEDQVHMVLDGLNQVDLSKANNLPVEHAIRAALRSDPDVLMVGELTSAEAVKLCHEAAMLGQLVLTTLHCMGGIQALQRLRDIGVRSRITGDSLRLVCSQRLLRKLCPHCAQSTTLDPQEEEDLVLACESGGLPWEQIGSEWRRAVGCERCHQIGYIGRSMVCELLELRDELREALVADADEQELQRAARRIGTISLEAEAIRLAGAGTTTVDEVRRLFDL